MNKRIFLLSFIIFFLVFFSFSSQVKADEISIEKAAFDIPRPAVPHYNFRVKFKILKPLPLRVKSVSVNGNKVYHFELMDLSWGLDLNKPVNLKWPLFAVKNIGDYKFKSPCLIGKFDWEKGKSYKIRIDYSIGNKGKIKTLYYTAKAPMKNGFWNRNWKDYKGVVVSEEWGFERKNEPIEIPLAFYPDEVTNIENEIRVVEIGENGVSRVLPSQVYKVKKFLKKDLQKKYDKKGNRLPDYWVPTVFAKVVTLISIKPHASKVLLVYYGNPGAKRLEVNKDLKVSGKGLALTIKNRYFTVELHPQSGAINKVTLNKKSNFTLLHGLETNGAVHWNPGAYSPPRPWVHVSDWNPPKIVNMVKGDTMFAIHRRDNMIYMPEIMVSITYKFFSNTPYFYMTSYTEILKDVALQALRNGEIVFAHKLIDKAAWKDGASGKITVLDLKSVPILTEVLFPLNAEWVCFFNSKEKIGFGGIPVENSSASHNLEPMKYNYSYYITRGPWVYWTRMLVTPYLTHNMQQIIPVSKGNSYWEKWAWVPFEVKNYNFNLLNEIQKRVTHPLNVEVIDFKQKRSKIPPEIYTDPTKTGWEHLKKED